MIFPLVFRTPSSTHQLKSVKEVMSNMNEALTSEPSWVELVLSMETTLECIGTRSALTLRQLEGDSQKSYCLSKRKQTSHQLEAAGKSVVVPHHQILQKEDAELILWSILEGKEVPDAYHLEEIFS